MVKAQNICGFLFSWVGYTTKIKTWALFNPVKTNENLLEKCGKKNEN